MSWLYLLKLLEPWQGDTMQTNSAPVSFVATVPGLLPGQRGRSAKARDGVNATRTRPLPKGHVMRLESAAHLHTLIVQSGTIWLTATPAQGDVIIQAGETHLLTGQGPWVIEALETAEMGVVQK